MIKVRRSLGWLVCSWLTLACADTAERLEIGVTGAALGACDETVPANRFIDGIPSYAQCDATKSSAIYSNNGVDTATMSMGAGWVRTQYSGGYQCTELAHRYLYFKWQVKWIPNGNAGMWCDTPPPANSGVVQSMTPVHGDLMVLAPGSCGADATTGHVTVVDVVDSAKSRLTVVEQNGARRGNYMASCGKCFLHVTANDGTSMGQPIAAAGGSSAVPPSAAAGTGAAAGDAMRPRGVAGSAAPPPSPQTPPAQTPPAQTPPAPPPSAAGSVAPPAIPSPSANRAVPVQPSTRVPRSTGEEASSCSVAYGPGARGISPTWLGLFALVLVSRRDWRRARRRPR
jgi:hypothetical protein